MRSSRADEDVDHVDQLEHERHGQEHEPAPRPVDLLLQGGEERDRAGQRDHARNQAEDGLLASSEIAPQRQAHRVKNRPQGVGGKAEAEDLIPGVVGVEIVWLGVAAQVTPVRQGRGDRHGEQPGQEHGQGEKHPLAVALERISSQQCVVRRIAVFEQANRQARRRLAVEVVLKCSRAAGPGAGAIDRIEGLFVGLVEVPGHLVGSRPPPRPLRALGLRDVEKALGDHRVESAGRGLARHLGPIADAQVPGHVVYQRRDHHIGGDVTDVAEHEGGHALLGLVFVGDATVALDAGAHLGVELDDEVGGPGQDHGAVGIRVAPVHGVGQPALAGGKERGALGQFGAERAQDGEFRHALAERSSRLAERRMGRLAHHVVGELGQEFDLSFQGLDPVARLDLGVERIGDVFQPLAGQEHDRFVCEGSRHGWFPSPPTPIPRPTIHRRRWAARLAGARTRSR